MNRCTVGRSVLGFILLLLSAGAARAFDTADMIGRWGVASYFDEKDAARMTATASSACAQPYVINRGRNGGAVMFSAFQGRPVEVKVEGGRVKAMSGDDGEDKLLIRAEQKLFVLRCANGEAAQKYGAMIFVRCGR